MLNFQTVNINQNPSKGAHIQSMYSLPIQYSYRWMHSLHIHTCVAPCIHPSKCTSCSFVWLWALYHWLWSISRNNNQGKIHSRVGVRVRTTFSVSYGSRFRRKHTAISQSFFVQVKREEIRLTPTHLRGEHSGSPWSSFEWLWWWWCSWKWKEMCFQANAMRLRWCNQLSPGMMKVELLFYEEAQFPGCTRCILCMKLNLFDGLQGIEING